MKVKNNLRFDFFLTFCLTLLFPQLGLLGLSQLSGSDKYVSKQWTIDDGLPQSSVNHIIQTRDGYLWLATFGGLVRFNGESFTTFNRSNTKGLRSDRMLLLYEDKSGAIWCSTEDGFSRFKDGAFITFHIKDSVFDYSPLIVTEDSCGTLWVSANRKTYRFENDKFIFVPVTDNPRDAQFALNNHNGAWIISGRTLLRTFGDSLVLIKNFSSIIPDNFQFISEEPEHPGKLWFATSGSGVVRYNVGNDSVRIYTPADGLLSRYILRVYFDHTGTLLTSGFNGISKFNGERFIPLRTTLGVDDQEFNTVIQDNEGSYWAGAPSRGLRRMRPSIITTLNKDDGLVEGKMLSLCRKKDGTFLFGTNCGGIYEYKNGTAAYSSLNASLVNLCVWSVFEDSQGRLWTGSRVLVRFDNGKRMLFDKAHGFNGEDIFAITEDSKNNIWIGCLNGLYMWDGKQFHSYTKENGLTHNDVRALYEDNAGIMWIGTSNGLHKFENGKIVSVPLILNGGNSVEPLSSYIRSIHQDETGTLWFGTYGGGILRLKNGVFSAITTANGLADNIVSHIVEDEQKFFWMGNNRGIVRVSRNALNNVADGKKNKLYSYEYGVPDGMISPETNGGFQPSVATDEKGNIYFPTVNGIAVVATSKATVNKIVPPVKIEKIFLHGNEIPSANNITLPYDSADIEIHFASLSYADQSKIQYRYKIEGFDEQWIDIGNRNKAYYTNIPAGTWTFRVIASNNDGVWNETGDSLTITITPPFWETWWFYTLAGFFFVGIITSIYYVRVTQLQKERQRQQLFAEQLIDSQEQERRRIAMELHDGLGQQILIIKNRAEIALSQSPTPEELTNQLRKIADSAVDSINDVRAISHGLSPVHLQQFGLTETARNLGEQLQQTSSIKWAYYIDDVDDAVPLAKHINFYRILQEGANNILRHSEATQASIMVRRYDTEVTLSLWDNGKGFVPQKKSHRIGLGLSGIAERATTLNGTCEIKSAPNKGTTIMVIIPLGKNT